MLTSAQTICIRSDAFRALLDEVVAHIDQKFNLSKENLWVDSKEAMDILKIDSRSTLAKIRDEGKIVYSNPSRKWILYSRASLLQYIDSFKKETF